MTVGANVGAAVAAGTLANGYKTAPLGAKHASGWVSAAPVAGVSDMEANLGYYRKQIPRPATHEVHAAATNFNTGANAAANGYVANQQEGWMVMKFKIASSGLLSQHKYLPVDKSTKWMFCSRRVANQYLSGEKLQHRASPPRGPQQNACTREG